MTDPLKSDFNEVHVVLEMRKLLCKKHENHFYNKFYIFKKNSTHKKYLSNMYFILLLFGSIWMKVDTTVILAGRFDVVQHDIAY